MHPAGHKHWGSSMTGGPRTTEQGRLHVRGKLGRAYCFPPVWVDQFHGFGPGHRLVPQNMLLQPPSREIFCEESCTPVLLVSAQCRTSTRSLAHFNFLRRRGRGGEGRLGLRSGPGRWPHARKTSLLNSPGFQAVTRSAFPTTTARVPCHSQRHFSGIFNF